MRNYVIINGVNSLTIQGLAINNLPPITKPMIRTQREEIDGRDGDIVTELGYSAYDKQMEIGLYGNFDIDAIIKYFTGEGTIVFSNEEDKYYNFKILDQIDYEKLLKFKTAVVTFHCQPFKYPVEETPIEGEAITITGSGSNITLDNTVVAPMDMKLKGNTIQDGTPTPDSPVPVQVVSGDNSIEVLNGTQSASYPISLGVDNLISGDMVHTNNGLTTMKLNDGGFKIYGTATTTYAELSSFFNCTIPTGNYIFSNTEPIANDLRIAFYDSSNGSLGSATITAGSKTTTTTISTTVAKVRLLLFTTQNTTYDLTIYPQLEKGEVAHTFTPYGKALELCKIGTYQDKIDKSTGKNLFDESILDTKKVSEDNDCYIFDNDTLFKVNLTPNVTFKENTSYTIQYIAKQVGTGNPRLIIFYTDGTYENVGVAGISTTLTTYTQISNANKTIDYISGIYGGTGSFYIKKNSVLVYEGSIQNPTYEPYGTGWYLKKEIGKVVLNGSENWNLGSMFYANILSNSPGIGASQIYSNYFIWKVGASDDNSIAVPGTAGSSNNYIWLKASQFETTSDLTTWLGTHNTIVYYPLATPTYETITDTTLIGQLEALKPYSYNPVTNITQTNNDAPFELDVSLSYTNTMNVNNVGNIYAKPILTIEGSGTIGIILNDIEVLSVDLGTDEKITIDVPNLQAYNPDNDVLLNRNVTGDYMKLLINDGDNTIAFSGSVTSATLTNYTRWI